MLAQSPAFSGFSVDDLPAARYFYGEVLGLEVSDANGMLRLHIPGSREILIYARPDHQPARYTILNFPVHDIGDVVDQLAAKGVQMTRYDGLPQDDKGVMRGRSVDRGPDIAWFTDPAGNVLSVLQSD